MLSKEYMHLHNIKQVDSYITGDNPFLRITIQFKNGRNIKFQTTYTDIFTDSFPELHEYIMTNERKNKLNKLKNQIWLYQKNT